MRNNLFYYLILFLLTVVDAWLLAHPNLLGRIGIFWYDYDYLDTFPNAMITVGLTVLAAVLLSWGIQKLSRPLSLAIAVALLTGCIFLTFQTLTKFSSGTYQFTGSGFKTGAILLPIILTIVFGKTTYDRITTKSV